MIKILIVIVFTVVISGCATTGNTGNRSAVEHDRAMLRSCEKAYITKGGAL